MDAKYDVPGGRPSKVRKVSGNDGGAMGLGEFNATTLARAAASNPKIKEYMKDEALMKKVNTLMGICSMGSPDMVPEGLLNSLMREDRRVLEIFMAAQGINVNTVDTSGPEFREAATSTQSASPSSPAKAATADSRGAASETARPAQKEPEKKEPEDSRAPEQKELEEPEDSR